MVSGEEGKPGGLWKPDLGHFVLLEFISIIQVYVLFSTCFFSYINYQNVQLLKDITCTFGFSIHHAFGNIQLFLLKSSHSSLWGIF